MNFEKKPLQSKKFVAFLFMEIILCGMAIVALFTQPALGWPLATYMTAIVITMGCIAFAFNGKQAWLDMYTRAIAITGKLPNEIGVDAAKEDE